MLPSEMRADMTMGLDLRSLENLRIFNGYETRKKERRLSFEEASSPDDNNESDTGQTEVKTGKGKPRVKSKCGRPANPIPRHKRDSHIKAEYKRRDKIQKGFDTLLTIVPELNGVSEKESKAKLLHKTADYCRRLKSECGSTQTELAALRQELETVGTEIQDLQDKLPKHGVETVKKNEDVPMDTLYDKYVEEETQKNWKFWIFGFFMRPLYDSFKQMASGRKDRQDLNSGVLDWVQNNLSLSNLRKGFLDALRTISKQTNIMTNPEQLEQEARSKVKDHCLWVKKEAQQAILTPPATPRAPTPAPVSSASCTPAPTPTPTPPRTPTVSRRSSKREIQRSTESRSRSNSPASEETKPKRRSNYRSRSGRRSGEECESSMDYATTVANPNLPLLSQLLTSPQPVKTSLFGAVTMATASGSNCTISSQKNTTDTSGDIQKMKNSQEELMMSFYQSLISSMSSKREARNPFTTAQTSNAFISLSVASTASGNEPSTHASTQATNICTEPMKMDVQDNTAGVFIPLSTSGVITNGSLVFQEEPFSNEFNLSVSQFEAPELLDFQSMELFSSESSSSTLLTDLPPLDSLIASSQMSTSEFSTNLPSQVTLSTTNFERTNNSLVNNDEDSLMNQLTLDVMDINCVMNFLNDDKTSQS